MARRWQLGIKRGFDILVSGVILVVFFPVWIIIALLIKATSEGSILFCQDRPGFKKKIFKVYKFRTMRPGSEMMVQGKEVMKDDDRVTSFGRFLRRSKLDEIPQLLNVLKGEMSLIGPRPERAASLADYTEEISKRLDMLPGLTGLAQVSGNIYLSLQERYKLDVYYVEHFSIGLDIRILLRTVGVVLRGEERYVDRPLVDCNTVCGVEQISPADAGFDDYAHKKSFHIDTSPANRKRVLITGAKSYIGESFEAYAKANYGLNFDIDTADMLDTAWKKKNFSGYDAVFHVAGIAHADIGGVDAAVKAKYYAVNRDLAIETASKAKAEGVKQFILMSSIIIYGDSAPYARKKLIDEHTLPSPANFYGDSKWQADKGVRDLASESFHAAVLRPPMIYGKNSKGNYPVLAKMAKCLAVFPDVNNERSMLYIDNLCEFLCKIILSGEGGIYFPQNAEYTKTSEMVKAIADAVGHSIKVTKLLRPAIAAASHIPGKVKGLVNKAFGNLVYDRKLSLYAGLNYQVSNLRDSIDASERTGR